MRIKILDFGIKDTAYIPYRAHENDAGADVYALDNYVINPNQTVKIPLGFGLELPDGLSAFVFPRSSMAAKGIVTELPPVDSGYRGQIHAITTNMSTETVTIHKGDRIGQVVIVPVILASFNFDDIKQRGSGAFGSTGK